MLIGQQAIKSLNNVGKIQPRMLVATFNDNPSVTNICYSPTNVSEETDLIAFYNELSSLVRRIAKHNVPVIGGGMDAQTGKNVNHDSSSRNGEHLTYFTQENRLTCFITKFQKMNRNLWTYTYANNT